ncbi:Sulfotransferase domain-containing protein [Lentibacillus halodurans]|uniref:Sulfotransferase domain-containing protein n=1 Tax=Lentibacillus halodurans TaxID=237679 RepID=A0A1I0XJX0_9BACI|nr:sulfotransferase [Lentibacillus halodurans]SFB00997.1 Sulfotransferase domain-containing protein [Lentibacillus halodurans]
MSPNFLVIGAEKSATTWIYNRLSEHPNVYLPATKEIHFFNQFDSNLKEVNNYEKLGLNWYKNFFHHYKGEKAIGEVTPMYLCDPKAPYRIKKLLPDVKIIAILRNPIDRAYSHYWMAKHKTHTQLTFKEAIETNDPRFVQRGLYYDQLRIFYSLFPKENIKVILFEDIHENNQEVLSNLYNFLGVRSSYVPEGLTNKENSSQKPKSVVLHRLIALSTVFFRTKLKMGWMVDVFKSTGVADKIKTLNTKQVKNETMDSADRKSLEAYYKESNKKLERLLQRNLNW